VNSLVQPAVVVEKLPAATTAAGCPSSSTQQSAPTTRASDMPTEAPSSRRRTRMASGTNSSGYQTLPPNPDGGFGTYLCSIGLLDPAQLEAVLTEHYSTGTRVGDAAVSLGFISKPKVDWAALAYHTQG
jgi:hypothetical protein